jgi:hypothetical protein
LKTTPDLMAHRGRSSRKEIPENSENISEKKRKNDIDVMNEFWQSVSRSLWFI